MQVLIPMSGQGVRFQKAGFTEPKPLVPVHGTPMIERLLKSFPTDWPCTFVIAENHRSTNLEKVLRNLRPQAQILVVPQNQTGPWLAISSALSHLDPTQAVLVSYCDYGMKWNPRDFEKFVERTECDACLVSYRGFHAHYLSPLTYAYSRLEGERVKEVREKGSFTDQRENEFASCGAYYFRNVADLGKALEYQKAHDLAVNGEYYTSLTVEALLRMNPQTQVRVYEMDEFYQWGTPEDLKNFEYWETTYQNQKRFGDLHSSSHCSQILMPMAGAGSRLASLSNLPKPLLPVNGAPMYRQALKSFPQSQKTVFVTLDSIARQMKTNPGENTVSLPATPAGQALTTEKGLGRLNTGDCIVTSCDHAIVLDPRKWRSFIAAPDCDAAVFTISGFPGTRRKPFSFSYVKCENTAAAFPLVSGIGVKQPFTENPAGEALLTGSFWFASMALLQKGLLALKSHDTRHGGELYLDGIFSELIKMNMKVRAIPLDGYVNWGDSESFKEALYWQKIFTGSAE